MNISTGDVMLAQERYTQLRQEAEQRARVARLLAAAGPAPHRESKGRWPTWRWLRRGPQPAGTAA